MRYGTYRASYCGVSQVVLFCDLLHNTGLASRLAVRRNARPVLTRVLALFRTPCFLYWRMTTGQARDASLSGRGAHLPCPV